METELDAFLQELNQAPMNTDSDIIASWMEEIDKACSPNFARESQDFQMLDDRIAQFSSSEFEAEPFPLLPTQPDSHDSYPFTVFDLDSGISSESPDHDHPLLHPESLLEPDLCDTFLNNVDLLSLIAPSESQGSMTVDVFEPTVELEASTPAIVSPNGADAYRPINGEMSAVPATDGAALGLQCDGEENNEENYDESDDEGKQRGGASNCRNLVSERKRRRRLSQQLLALRALVPNITKMDKRSVLVDALFYLKSIHEETARIEVAVKQQPHQHLMVNNTHQEASLDHSGESLGVQRILASRPKPQIIEIDIEKMENTRFVVKIRCQGGAGVGGHVLRVMETMGCEISYTSMENIKSEEVLTTIFIRVRKQEKMTEEKLKDGIINTAVKSGLTVQKA